MDLDYNVPDSYLPKNYNRRNVLNDTNGSKGVNKYVNDEIYNSLACYKSIDGSAGSNHQGAYYIDGKYYFDFPSIWYNSNSVNKAIGLRSINIYPRSYNLEYSVVITTTTDKIPVESVGRFIYTVNPKANTEEVIDGMRQQMESVIPDNQKKYFTILALYEGQSVKFIMKHIGNIKIPPAYDFDITNTNASYDAFFGQATKHIWTPPASSNVKDPGFVSAHTYYEYKGIWNRRDLFLHASFVNYTSFNYLGKDGEFYPKISKIYDFAFAPQKFYFELSYDGMHPIKTEQVDFMVGLCLIVDEKKYNGE